MLQNQTYFLGLQPYFSNCDVVILEKQVSTVCLNLNMAQYEQANSQKQLT